MQYDITKPIYENINNFNVKYLDCFAGINPPVLFTENSMEQSFFRMRILSDIAYFEQYEEYSYPPNSGILGRANLPNNPVFYCSLSPITAIKEMKKHNRKVKYAISKWKMKDSNKSIKIVPTFTKETEHHSNIMIEMANIKSAEQQKLYLEFIGKQLLSKNYSNSAFLAYNLIYMNNIDAITYPSVINGKYPNMAISPQLIDNGTIELDKVYIVEIKEPKEVGLIEIIGFSDNNVERISSKNLLPNNIYLQEFKNDFKL